MYLLVFVHTRINLDISLRKLNLLDCVKSHTESIKLTQLNLIYLTKKKEIKTYFNLLFILDMGAEIDYF